MAVESLAFAQSINQNLPINMQLVISMVVCNKATLTQAQLVLDDNYLTGCSY